MAYNSRLDHDVMDESTECTAIAIPKDNESTTDNEFATLTVSYDDPVLADLDTNEEVDLAQFEQMETNAFRRKCLDLFKIWSIMKENMTKSGTHDSDPYNFVEVAMRGFTGLTPISVFYFYKRCDEHPDIDSVFQLFMNYDLKGNSITWELVMMMIHLPPLLHQHPKLCCSTKWIQWFNKATNSWSY